MAKKFKKLLSIVLTISMCMSLVSISAYADGEPAVTENPDGSVTTVTVTFDSAGNSTTTSTTESDWNDTTVVPGTSDGSTTSSTTTTVTGQETTTESTTKKPSGFVSGTSTSASGSEKTEITETTTEVETQKDVIINGGGNGETNPGEPKEIDKTDGSPVESNLNPDNGGWTEGTPTEPGTWADDAEKSSDGSFEQQGETSKPEESGDVSVNEPGGQIRLDLTPGGKDEEKVYFGIDDTDFDMNKIPAEVTGEPYTDPETGKTGNKTITVNEVKDAGGNIIGYDVTTTITYDEEQTSGPVTGEMKETGKISNSTTTKTEPAIPADWNKDETVEKDDDGNITREVVMTKNPIYDGDQIVGYTITKTTTDYNYKSDSADSTAESTTTSSAPVETFTLPDKPADGVSQDASGNTVTTTVEEIIEGGRPVGYKTIVVTTNASGKEIARSSSEIFGTTTKVSSTTVTDPTRTVTDTTTKTQKVETTTIYGTIYTQDAELEQVRTTEYETDKTVETDNYRLVEIDGKMYYLYTGEMGTVSDAGSTGTTKLDSIKANEAEYNTNQSGVKDNDIQSAADQWNPSFSWRGADGKWYSTKEEAGLDALKASIPEGGYILVGRGMISEYNLYDDRYDADKPDSYAHVATNYAVMDSNGNIQYGYCVELGKDLSYRNTGSGVYEESELLNHEKFYDSEEKVAKLAIIAHNGFWGTYETDESGNEKEITGSLAYIKNLIDENRSILKDKGYSDDEIDTVISDITAGQALAGTQASIWKYGTKGEIELTSVEHLFQYYPGTASDGRVDYDNDSQEYKNVNALFQVLTSMADKGLGTPPETITKDDLTNATIILDGKAKDDDGNVKTVNVSGKDHEQYNTDIAFTLAIAPSSINGDLVVKVFGNGDTDNPIATKRLAGDDSLTNFGKIVADENGTYTIENLEIAEGVTITLKLEGTQHLANGVYVYECANSQNFIGLSSVDHDVDLSVDLKFSVEEPETEVKHSGSTQSWKKTRTRAESRKSSRTDSRETVTSETDSVTTEQISTVTKVYADLTITEVTTESAVTAREWSSSSAAIFTEPGGGGGGGGNDPDPDPEEPNDPVEIPEEPVPLSGDGGGDGELEDLFDDEVPLAEAPETGDNAMVWYMMTLLSGLGLAIMALTGKRREN